MSSRKRKNKFLHTMLIGTSVVLFWRGAWGLMDLFLFPNDHFLSYLISLIAGVGVLIYTHKLVDELS